MSPNRVSEYFKDAVPEPTTTSTSILTAPPANPDDPHASLAAMYLWAFEFAKTQLAAAEAEPDLFSSTN